MKTTYKLSCCVSFLLAALLLALPGNVWGQNISTNGVLGKSGGEWRQESSSAETFLIHSGQYYQGLGVYSYTNVQTMGGAIKGTMTEQKTKTDYAVDAVRTVFSAVDIFAGVGGAANLFSNIAGMAQVQRFELDAALEGTITGYGSMTVNNEGIVEYATIGGLGMANGHQAGGILDNHGLIGYTSGREQINDKVGATVNSYGKLNNIGADAKITSVIVSGEREGRADLWNSEGAYVGVAVVGERGYLQNIGSSSTIDFVSLVYGGKIDNLGGDDH